MKRNYIVVTYEVCEHNNIYEDMNEYLLDSSTDLENKIWDFARTDVAPLVKVYKSDTSDFEELKFYKEYRFQEYECGCNQ